MSPAQDDVRLVYGLYIRLRFHDDAVAMMKGLATHPPPVMSVELGRAHHMKDEEGGLEEQRSVHGLFLFPRSQTLLLGVTAGLKRVAVDCGQSPSECLGQYDSYSYRFNVRCLRALGVICHERRPLGQSCGGLQHCAKLF